MCVGRQAGGAGSASAANTLTLQAWVRSMWSLPWSVSSARTYVASHCGPSFQGQNASWSPPPGFTSLAVWSATASAHEHHEVGSEGRRKLGFTPCVLLAGRPV